MAPSMQNWIASVVLGELSAVYECFEPDYQPTKTIEQGHYTSSEGRITVLLTEGRRVQIIDFNARHKHPFDVTLSDGTNKIRATFGKACTKEFSKLHDRKFTDRTVGGVLAIESYSLIFDPKSAPLKRLMLKVSKFKLLGSEGSSPSGQPLGIEEQPGVLAVMTKLNNLITSTGDTAVQVEEASPIHSQTNPLGAGRKTSPPMSSVAPAFATQVHPREYGHGSDEAANEKHYPSKNPPDLLSILKQARRRSGQPSHMDKEPASQVGITQEKNNADETVIPSDLRSLDGKIVIEGSSRRDDRANTKHGEISSSQPPPGDTREENFLPVGIESPHPHPMTSLTPDDSEKETNQEKLRLECQGPSKVPDISITENQEEHILQVLVLDEDTHKHPFEGLKRIPRSYVRVPEQQQVILERNNSWFQPGNHNTSSYVNNIPPAVLQDLNSFANRIAALRVPNHTGDPRLDEGAINGDDRSDIKEMDAEAENNEDPSDIEDIPRGAAFEKPDCVSSSLDCPTGEHGPGTLDEENGGCHSIIPSLDVDMVDSNEHVNDDQDEIDEGSSEGTPLSCDLSPQPDRGSNNQFVPESENAELPSLLAEHEMDVDGPPQSKVGGGLITSHAAAKAHKFADAALPSSSLPSEDELQMEMLHTIGEPIDEHVHEENISQEALREPRSTVAQDRSTIQVEQTPNSNSRRFEKPTVPNRLLQGRKRRLEEISSDAIIPNTASQEPQVSQQSSGSVEFKSQSTSTGKETDNHERHFMTIQALVDDCVNPSQDAMPDHFALVEAEGTQPIMSSPIESPYEPQGTPKGVKKATRIRWQMGNLTKSPVPQLQLLNDDGMVEAREPLFDGDTNQIPKSPEHLRLRPRKALRFATWQFSQEEYAAKDTDEMARASRRDFSDRFAAPKAEESDPITNTSLSTSTISQLDPDATPELTPATAFELPQLTGPDTSAVAQSHFTTLVEPTPGISIPSTNPLKSQMNSALYDMTESARQTDADAQPSKDALNTANRVPEPAKQPMAYDKFIMSYPDYQGNEEQFVNGLVYIEWLVNKKGKNFLRKSLWDDLLRVLADDYVDYIQDPVTSGKKMKGLEFYNDIDQDPIFKQMIVTPTNLQDLILSHDLEKVEEVRRVYGIGRNPKDKNGTSAATSPRSEQFTMSKPSTLDQLRQQEPEQDLQVDGDFAVAPQEKSPIPVIQADDSSATDKPLFFETRSQVQQNQPEIVQDVVVSLGKSLAQPIRDSVKRTTPESLSIETHSQTQVEQLETTSDAIIESIEVSLTKSFKSPGRVLPWPAQEGTTVHSEIESSPSSPHVPRRPSELPSKPPIPRRQAQQEKPSVSVPKPVPKARTSMPSAQDQDNDPFTSPKPRALDTTARRIKSLPNGRTEKPGGTKAIRDAGSSKKVEFLIKFARNWRASEMSSKTSTPESKRTRRF